MLLTLSIKNHQGKTTPTREEYNFGQAGGSIGRAPNNDWALPDQNNYLSKKHAIIEFNEGHFYIIDKSVNGVFINYSTTPLGRENRHQICASDEILIGEYTLIVSQLDESINIKNQPIVDVDTESTPKSTKKPKSPRFKLKKHKPTDGSGRSFDEMFNKKQNDENAADTPVDEKKPAEITHKDKVQAQETEKTNDTNNPEPLDHIAKDKVTAQKAEKINDANDPEPLDHIAKAQQTSNEKPEEKKKPLIQQQDSPSKTKEKQATTEPPKIKATNKALEQHKQPARHTSQEKTTGDESKIKEKKDTTPQLATDDALTHILHSAGLSTEDINNIESTVETYQLIGQILKESLDGTMNLLRTRHAAKNHLNLDNTLISRRKNNPLKFLPNTQFVLRQTLPSQSDYVDDTFLPLHEALMEAYDDISAHEYAMATSIQEALAITIKKHFSPSSLEKKLAKNSPIISKIPLKREADLWQLFTSIYDEIAEEASESFQVLLDKEIVNAYEIQIKHLKAKR